MQLLMVAAFKIALSTSSERKQHWTILMFTLFVTKFSLITFFRANYNAIFHHVLLQTINEV